MANPPSELTQNVTAKLLRIVEGEADFDKLTRALRLLSKWRSQILSQTLINRSGSVVLGGPFKGMSFGVRVAEGAEITRLLGAYEAGLIPVIETIIASAPDVIIDIGSAEGYYAIGLARRLPGCRILARDIDPAAREKCRTMAEANGVGDRVEIGGAFGHADFDLCASARSVVICDIEGAEDALLDPVLAPGLLQADILVETHIDKTSDLDHKIARRFEATHRITRIGRKLDDSGLPDWMETVSDIDRLLALWEWRNSPTPWLWMEKR